MRTLVVASATLAILLVCYAIYTSSQLPADSIVDARTQYAVQGESHLAPDALDSAQLPSDLLDVGPGRKVRLTVYPKRGNRGGIEVSVNTWTPVPNASDMFLLTEPEIRMRTRDGNALRITAERGYWEAERNKGGGFEPSRGTLTGGVVIEYDRLTEADRALLPPAAREQVHDADIIRIETKEIEFDLEYAKIILPNSWTLVARDVELEASDLEVRLDEEEDRVDSLRISHGGRIVLRDSAPATTDDADPTQSNQPRRRSIAEQLGGTKGADAVAQANATGSPKDPTEPIAFTADGVPIFDVDANISEGDPQRYVARFEGDVEVTQGSEHDIEGRLAASALEVIRVFTGFETATSSKPDGPHSRATSETPVAASQSIVLQWTDRLLVEVCTDDKEQCAGNVQSKVTAIGTPAVLSIPQGRASGANMIYDGDASDLTVTGNDDHDAEVRYAGQGTIAGQSIQTRRTGDDLAIDVGGPGRLVREIGSTSAPAVAGLALMARESASTIAFAESLHATGHYENESRTDYTGHVLSRERRVMDQATFLGTVRFADGDTKLDADSMALRFSPASHATRGQTIEQMNAVGHVHMVHAEDELTCREVELEMTINGEGHAVPRVATALGDIEAVQQTRTIRAHDKLVVTFEMINPSPPPIDIAAAFAKAVASGDIGAFSALANRPKDVAPPKPRIGVRRLEAAGQVIVADPAQGLKIRAERLLCDVVDGQTITTAHVEGSEDHPCTVELESFTVTGRTIRVDARDQWADVPGAGRLSFLSYKDLDGRRLAKAIPIVITWTDWMKYRGRENRAVFVGSVHATSETTTTFDCQRLEIEFDDAPETDPSRDRTIFEDVATHEEPSDKPLGLKLAATRFSKEPARILATGQAIALTSQFDPDTGRMTSRVRIEGPILSVNLRHDVSKMLIEGPGSLLVEDNRPVDEVLADASASQDGLFGFDKTDGASNTLIQWQTEMIYDFSIDQLRFEGKVQMKHFSGAELMRIRGAVGADTSTLPPGRATLMNCDVLAIDFLDRSKETSKKRARRMGRLSARSLAQFEATGHVVLQDRGQHLSLTAGRLVYLRDRALLSVYGSLERKMQIVIQREGQLPMQASGTHLFYNLKTRRIEGIAAPSFKSRQ